MKKIAKETKELNQRFGKMAEILSDYHHHIDFRCLDDFDDKAFAFVMKNVKGVNMLDLNETKVGNESIHLLTNLEYVNEIRAKECCNLNNDCVEDLNKITSLVFLHLKNTGITIDGVLKLKNLTNLKTLMFSADDVDEIKFKLLQLKTMLPSCEIVVNSKAYYVNAIDIFIEAIKTSTFEYRLKIKNQSLNTGWSKRLIQTAGNYIKSEVQGEFSIDDIEWVEIKPTEKNMQEKLIEVTKHNSWGALIKLLEVLEFPYMENDGKISAYIINKDI